MLQFCEFFHGTEFLTLCFRAVKMREREREERKRESERDRERERESGSERQTQIEGKRGHATF